MNTILVNLLPKEVILSRKQSSKITLANKVSVGVLIALAFFTSVTLTLRIVQDSDLKKAQQELVYAQDRVIGLKGTEEQMVVLKQRLSSIQSLIGGDSKRKAIFNLVIYLMTPDMQISEASVDKKGVMDISFTTTDLSSLEYFITQLSDKEKTSDLIGKVDLGNFSTGKNGIYNLSLKIAPK